MTTVRELEALIAESRKATKAFMRLDVGSRPPGYEEAEAHYHKAFNAVQAARPTDLPGMALWLRWWHEELGSLDGAALACVIECLEVMAAKPTD